jgi:hypothetical protein
VTSSSGGGSVSTRAEPDNPAGVVFRPDGDVFHVWDNKRDDALVTVRYTTRP